MNTDDDYKYRRKYNDIPLTAYTHWHSRKVLYFMYNTVNNNIKNNPEIDFYIYDENEASLFIKNNFNNDVINAYNKLKPDSYKSDLFRYCILYMKGGIYYDIKFIFHKKLIDIIKKYETTYVKDFDHCNNAVYTGFMITKPKNPVYLDCINQIIKNTNINYYGNNSLYPTGPCLLSNSLSKYYYDIPFTHKMYKIENDNKEYVITDYDDVTFIILNPYIEYRDEQKILQNKDSYSTLWNNKDIYY
jgi:mannosyltransferase OCH1-like enzyme